MVKPTAKFSFMELKKIHISDIGKVVTGKTPRTSVAENYGGDIPFLTPSDNLSHKSAPKMTKTLTEQGLNEVRNCLLPPHSVCVSCIGSDLGKVVMTIEPTVTNQQFNSIIPNTNFNADFVYYLMTLVGKELNYLSKTSTAVPIINKSSFSNYEVEVPKLKVQEKIASILSSLDDKIELNRRINDNLEQQAQALFKSWFVDFEPFRGEKFVESQLGMIPKGWKVGTLFDLLDIRYGKDHKKLNDGNIPVYGSGGIMRLADGILYNGESVLIPRKGTLNNVLYVNWPFWTVDTMFYSIEKVPNVAKYCHLLLSKLDLASMNSGSAVPSMTTDILNKIQVIVPNQNVFSSFNECISSLYLKAKINLDENKRLSETRDLLLPKLMSGRLIIKDLHS